jgi:hypothetical protein
MDLTAEQFNRLFSIQQLSSRLPVEDRWRAALPNIDPSTFAALKARCIDIQDFAYALAGQAREKGLSSETVRQELAREYPFLDAESLRWAINRAMVDSSF